MAEQPQANALASAFPTPPPFWQHFTPENISRIEALRAAESDPEAKPVDPADGLPLRILDLPPELRWLQPPEPPSNGIYRCFGDTFNVRNFDGYGYTHNAGQNLLTGRQLNEELPSLADQGIEQLYTPPATPTGSGKHSDRALILKRLAKSLLLNFLELLGIMNVNPEQVTRFSPPPSGPHTPRLMTENSMQRKLWICELCSLISTTY